MTILPSYATQSIDIAADVNLVMPTPHGQFVVRRMTRAELDQAVQWAAAEGWNPGVNDAECFYQADPRGFFMGQLNGEMIGSCFAVAYGDRYAFIGGYIVKSEWRHRGFGMLMTQVQLAYLDRRTAGLDGVVAMQSKYARLGFRLAHRSIRYGGTAHGQGATVSTEIVDLAQVPFDELAAYDLVHFSAPRRAFLQSWIRQPGATALGAIQDGRLAGYGVVRPCQVGNKIGPLFADSEPITEDLLDTFGAVLAGETIYLDVPETNPRAVALAERHGLSPVFEVGRMYRQGEPTFPHDHVFGITTFELG